MHTEAASRERPPITLLHDEAEALFDLALASLTRSQLGAKLLLEELERADTSGREELSADVVTMGSRVVFADEASGEQHSVELVYPKDADAERHRVSVLTPIGAALIGMRRGGAIDWPNRSGVHRVLRIVDVAQPGAGQ